jgi:enoyl-CoA hydratase/carnithine racemase
MSTPDLLTEKREGVMVVTLNRPDKLNALNRAMITGLLGAVADAGADPDVRVIVITGAGRGFCAGVDLGILAGPRSSEPLVSPPATLPEPQFGDDVGPPLATTMHAGFGVFLSTRKPIIAAVNGPAVGFGLAIALHCDIRLASSAASFNTTFARLAVPAEQGLGWLLPRIVGPAVAADLLFAPRPVSADEAHRIGLANRVFDVDGFFENVLAYAHNIAANSAPRSLAVMKAQIWGYESMTYDDALQNTDYEILVNTASEDFKEAVSSYMRKEPPRFTGR